MKLSDVAALDPDITAGQLQERYGADEDAVSLLTVAEATLNRVPAQVTHWLSSPAMSPTWEHTLAIQEGRHQLSWWDKMATLGIEDPAALRADRRLARIRQRRSEAHLIADAWTALPSRSSAVAEAAEELKAAHVEEAEWLTDRLQRSTGIEAIQAHTPKVAELLAMGDENFQDLVARDVQGRTDVDGLGHPAVLARRYGALVELGTATFAEIGIEVAEHHVRNWFAVPDRHLIQNRHDAPVEKWAPKLTFLTHVRAALIERHRLRRHHLQQLGQQVDLPVEQHLVDRYSMEYDRYLRNAQQSAAAPDGDQRPPHPAAFDAYAALLQQYNWDVKWIFDGHRIWVDAWPKDLQTTTPTGRPTWRDGGRLIVTAVRNRSAGRSAWHWGKPTFVNYSRRQRRYTLLTGPDALEELAETRPRATPDRYFKAVLTHTREHLEAHIPPDGYRWRHPFPEALTALGYT